MLEAPPVPHLELFTVKVMTLVTIFVVNVATLLAWRVNPASDGMRLFALGLSSIAVGALLGLLRLIVSGPFVLVACNIFMIGGMIVAARGVRVFRQFPPWPASVLVAFCLAVAVPYFYWLLFQDNFGMRVGVVSTAFSILCADAAISMLRGATARLRLTYWPTSCAFAFAAAYLALRAAGGWSGWYGESLFVASPNIELISTICADIAYIGCGVGMILASNTHLWHQAERMALVDPLTNLPNRRWFLDRLLAAECRALAGGHQLGIIYLDLDGFKAVNDRLGHAIGDALLQSVGAAMLSAIRSSDCAARMGGDEFVVLAEHVESRSQLATLAGRLKARIERATVPGRQDERVRVSMGMAIFPLDADTAHDTMREADAAMYSTKRQARWAQPSVG